MLNANQANRLSKFHKWERENNLLPDPFHNIVIGYFNSAIDDAVINGKFRTSILLSLDNALNSYKLHNLENFLGEFSFESFCEKLCEFMQNRYLYNCRIISYNNDNCEISVGW